MRWQRSRMVAGACAVAALLAPPVRGGEPFQCELTASSGLSDPDARAATRLICDQVRTVARAEGRFEIELGTLGRMVIVTARRAGSADAVTVQLEALEEVPRAAGRIADAVVRNEAFTATQRVDNLLPGETRSALAKKGSVKFMVGVANVESAGHGARAAGFSLGILYSASRFALPAEMRFAWDDATYGEKELSLFSLSLGGRAYLSRRDVSPFVGAGLGVLALHASEGLWAEPASAYFEGRRWGAAPYLEAGVEMLRLHRGRIALQVRADLPSGSLRSPEYTAYASYDPRTGQPLEPTFIPAQARYVVPISIGVSVAF